MQVFKHIGDIVLRNGNAPDRSSVACQGRPLTYSLGLVNIITHLGLTRAQIPLQPLISLSPILDGQRELERLASEIHQDIRGGMKSKDRGQRSQDGQDSNAEIVKGTELVDFAALELVVGEGEELYLARDLGGVDDAEDERED